MEVKGHPHAHFQRAMEAGNLIAAEAAARELGHLTLADAFDLLFLYTRKAPERWERAAVRWHGRFALEVSPLTLADSQLVLAALAGLRGANPSIPLQTVAALADRYCQTGVALTARRLPRDHEG